MQSGGKVCIYPKPQPLFAKLTKLQTLFAKPLEGYFLLFFANRTMQSLFAKPLKMLVVKLFYDMVWMLYENLGLLRLTLRKKGVIFRDVVRLDYKSKLSL